MIVTLPMPSDLQELAAVQRHVVKVVWDDRLRRAPETDLVGHDHAEALLAQRLDRAGEIEAAEIHPVEQDDRAAVGRSRGRHVHVGHSDVLAIHGQREIGDGIRVGDLVIGDAARLHVARRLGQVLPLRKRRQQEKDRQTDSPHPQEPPGP